MNVLFTYQEYVGKVPTLVPVAVNVNPVPEQIEVADAITLTEGETVELTTKFIPVVVTLDEAKQTGKVPLAVPIALTTSPLVGE